MTPDGKLKTLATFADPPFNKRFSPAGGLMLDRDGCFYGVAAQYPGRKRMIFRMTPLGKITTLAKFSDPAGNFSYSTLVRGRDGNFYGTSSGDFENSNGTAFRVTPSGKLTTLVKFSGKNGHEPVGLIMGSDGNFYGTTYSGGSSEKFAMGTVFRMTHDGQLKTLVEFTGPNGSYPTACLVQGSNGDFYGTTSSGPTAKGQSNPDNGTSIGYGTIFRMTRSGKLTTLVKFRGADGRDPNSGLIEGRDGCFYGACGGGPSGSGVVFKMTAEGEKKTLAYLVDKAGSHPVAGLLPNNDGNLYGTTAAGGQYGSGTIFKITTSGKLTALSSFPRVSQPSTEEPWVSALVRGKDANLYGTTNFGGRRGHGFVFKVSLKGKLRILVEFKSSVAGPSGLVPGTDGNFYGTTEYGGTHDGGTAFRVTPEGELTTLVSFKQSDGQWPLGGLVPGDDGNFYGTTFTGGANDVGTVFRMTLQGRLTKLVDFNESGGHSPCAALVLGNDGDFYGTTRNGGQRGTGTVFKITPAGVLTSLADFADGNGAQPTAPLLRAADGNFYGTTQYGGIGGNGTVFVVTPAGDLTTIKNLELADGSQPKGALVQGSDGNLYGTTFAGGVTPNGDPAGGGQIFRLRMEPAGTTNGGTPATFGGPTALAGSGGTTRSATVISADGNLTPTLTLLPEGAVSLAYHGSAGLSYQIQRTTDFESWETVATAVADPLGIVSYVDRSPPPRGAFYRFAKP